MSTYSQIYIQAIFAVKGRESLINPEWEDRLYKYITGIVQNKGQKMLAINGMPNHIHLSHRHETVLLSVRPCSGSQEIVK